VSGEWAIRRARPDDAESVLPLWQAAFNMPVRWVESFSERFRPERVLVAADGDRILASAQGLHMNQWFGGRPVPMIGVASVATDPLARGTGIAPRVVSQLLRDAREAGHLLSTLYPSTVPFYRRLGFEYGGVYTVHRLRLVDIPPEPAAARKRVRVVAATEDAHDGIRSSFRRLAEHENGVVEGLDEDWWRVRVLGRHSAEEPGGVVATEQEAPEAYAAYRQERVPDDWA
jgi:predicted acetyltransferase